MAVIRYSKFNLIVTVTQSRKGEGIYVMRGGERKTFMTLVWAFSFSQEPQKEGNLKSHTKVELQLISALRISGVWELPASMCCTQNCIHEEQMSSSIRLHKELDN